MASSHLTKPTDTVTKPPGAVTKPPGAVTRQMPQQTPTTGQGDALDVSDEASSCAAIGYACAPAARPTWRPGSGYAALASGDDAEMPTPYTSSLTTYLMREPITGHQGAIIGNPTPYTSSSPKAQAASCHWKQQSGYATPPRLPPPRSLGDDPDPDYSPSRPGVMVAPLPVTPSARRSTRGQLPPEPWPCAQLGVVREEPPAILYGPGGRWVPLSSLH